MNHLRSCLRALITSVLWLMGILINLTAEAQVALPKAAKGRIQRIEQFSSAYVQARTVDVWLPEGYSTQQKYSVVYMHDGQMLFDSTTTWNKQDWQADETASQLMATTQTREFIVVGIWNSGATRHPDYFPQKPYESLSPIQKDWVVAALQKAGRTQEVFRPVSDSYLKFIVTELKPYIDSHFSTHTDRSNTFVAGSSMGGLISMYALCEYPAVFGGAACLSTHWPGVFSIENNPIPASFIAYLKEHLPSLHTHKLYFDCGDQSLDALYPAIQKQVDEVLEQKGFTAKNWQTRYFPGKDHSEKAWSQRLAIPLVFLLKP
ncbi:MAG: alpha/beta hydrolase-fold protein [Spirosomataceae bacterium]